MSAELAVTVFFLSVPLVCYLAPHYIKSFQHPAANAMIKGGFYVMGTYTLAYAAGAIGHIAESSSLGLTSEIFTYLFIFELLARIGVYVLAIVFFLLTIAEFQRVGKMRRMGEYGAQE